MSDFIYSKESIEKGILTKGIQAIYHEDKPSVEEFHGDWGSLAVSRNLYNGFDSHETTDHICVVIGGPVLCFRDNEFLKDSEGVEGTYAIYSHWLKGNMQWDEDLSGSFTVLIINKKTSDVEFVTDLMSFIPVYMYQDSTNTILSTNVDMLANVSGQNRNYDTISCADFVLHGVVTFPYTLYQNIFQVKPATVHQIIHKSNKFKSEPYWIPKEEYKYNSIKEAADNLIKDLKNYTDSVTSKVTNIAQFISGGEDSRVLSALLQEYPRDAFVFLDQMNREGKKAEKAADAYGANFNLATRSKTHYIEILPDCSDLVGSTSQYHHAHAFGFHKSCNLNKYSAVFGGLLSDALLKGSHIKKNRNSNRLPLIPDIKDNKYSAGTPINNNIFTREILNELTSRRREHLKYIKMFRSESAEEWFELWPSSMNKNIPNIHANRKLFKSYEPFMDKGVVKISATVPQKWKLNRRLFRIATKPLLKPTKWLFHGDGWLPYFPWYINSFIRFSYRIYKKVGVNTGVIKGNQRSWGDWNVVVNSPEWKASIKKYSNGFYRFSSGFKNLNIDEILEGHNLNIDQKVNLMQVLYHTSNKN